ncbi:MAG: amidophosphoribosyltransferase [Nanoarchaeota archaeon]
MEEAGEECGICAIYLKNQKGSLKNTPLLLINSLSMLQHRGQKSAGISVFNPLAEGEERRKTLLSFKGVGRVSEVFKFRHRHENELIVERCQGIAGIGHTRYSTSGKREDYYSAIDEAQPFIRRHPLSWKKFSLAFNGNIVNYSSLCKYLEERGYSLETNVDTEVLMALISIHLKRLSSEESEGRSIKPSLFDVVSEITKLIDGSYNVLTLFGDGDLLVFRDPKGFRPLVWGENDAFYAVASESAVFDKIGISEFKDVEPGEAIIFNKGGVQRKKLSNNQQSFCHFEHVYFARPNSKIEGVLVKSVRQNLGRELSKIEFLKEKLNENYLVIPAPKTAIPAAEAYAESLNLQMHQAIEKNEEERGFINSTFERERIMKNSYIIHPDVKGRKIILIDDSIVRGETSKILISQLRNAGALEVHVRLTEPPIKHPCFYGIDYPTREELIAARLSKGIDEEELQKLGEKVAKEIGADSVFFQTIPGLIKAIGLPKENLCLACLTGEYPTPCGQKASEEAK